MGIVENVLARGIFLSHRHLTVERIRRKLIPETADSILSPLPIIKGGMRQVESYILQTDYDTLSGIAPRESLTSIDRIHIMDDCRRVEIDAVTAIRLNAKHLGRSRKCRNFRKRNNRYADVTPLCQFPAAIFAKHGLSVARDTHESSNLPSAVSIAHSLTSASDDMLRILFKCQLLNFQ